MENYQVTYKGKLIGITPDFSETLRARKVWTDKLQSTKQNNCKPKLLYPEKLSLKIKEKDWGVLQVVESLSTKLRA